MGANFRSDNVTGAHPAILKAIAAANSGPAMPYGNDEITRRLQARFDAVFETETTIFPVATGTAANALALAAAVPAWGAIYCHADSHVLMDECNAAEFYSAGARMVALEGAHGKIAAATLETALKAAPTGVHHAQPASVTITQLSEAGTAYAPAEVKALARIAHKRGLALHMDGARFANALVGLGCSPADVTWRAGLDMLSFGTTKNGAIAAEAIVVFRKDLAQSLAFRRKRAGHLFSKMRFLSAQLEAYLSGDLWLKNARHANKQAARIAAGLRLIRGVRIAHPVDGNEVFAEMPAALAKVLDKAGFALEPWAAAGSARPLMRLVAAFDTDPEDVEGLIETAYKAGAR
jgi:threonine aldolase